VSKLGIPRLVTDNIHNALFLFTRTDKMLCSMCHATTNEMSTLPALCFIIYMELSWSQCDKKKKKKILDESNRMVLFNQMS
jgi:hypothetical protein